MDLNRMRDPVWQFIGVIVSLAALILPLGQSNPAWYLVGGIIAFVIAYFVFPTIMRRIVNIFIVLYIGFTFLTHPYFSPIRDGMGELFQGSATPSPITESLIEPTSILPTDNPIITSVPAATSIPLESIAISEGGLYRMPDGTTRLGGIWPGDKVLCFEATENQHGQWVRIRVSEASTQRQGDSVVVGTEGWVRAIRVEKCYNDLQNR